MGKTPRAWFAFRLLACVAVALAVGGLVAYGLISRGIRDAVTRSALQSVQSTVAEAARQTKTADVATKLEATLAPFATDPDVVAAGIVDIHANPLIMQSFLDDTARRVGVETLKTRKPIVQRATRGEGLVVQQVASPFGEYAVVVELRERDVRPFLDAVLPSLLKAGVPAAFLVVLLVWLLGGRSLASAHQSALERAARDGLTGLGNHRAFLDDLERAAANAARPGGDFGLLLLDLDDFKRLNDEAGHHAGDALLCDVARALVACARRGDRTYRIGGDEFAMLLPGADEDGAALVGMKAHEALERVGARAGIGIGATRPTMRDGGQLRDEVDAAAYEAKARPERRVIRVSEVADTLGARDRTKAEALWQLVRDEALEVAFQPIWDLEAGRLIGVEALTRLPEDSGIGGPAEAFEIAERAGFGARLDEVCARNALRVAAEGGLPRGVLLFLNLTAETLAGDLGERPWLLAEVEALGLRPDRVVIEISEHFGRRPGAVVRGAKKLRSHGFGLALDDVGAGEAGLTRLRVLDLDFVKVDRSITSAAAHENGARAVLEAVAAYARATGAFVIAEGIEDGVSLAAVKKLSRPDPVAATIRGGQGFGLVEPQSTLAAALSAVPGLTLGLLDSVPACSPSPASTI